MGDYRDVLIDGLPSEDGTYEVLLNGGRERIRFLVRYTQSDGTRIWAGGVGCQIPEKDIVMYRRVRDAFNK